MSTLKADTLVASDGTSPVTLTKQSAPKMWVGWSYSSGVPIANGSASLNLSSITDTGTGDAAFNLTNAMSGTLDVAHLTSSNHSFTGNVMADKDSASIYACRVVNDSGTAGDYGGSYSISIIGDLA